MKTKLLLGLAAFFIAISSFVAGIAVQRFLPGLLATSPPTLLSPAEGAVLKNDVIQEFTWSKVPNADKYHVYVTHSTRLNNPTISQEMDVPVLLMSTKLLAIKKGWTWKVKVQVNGTWSKWSEVRMFDVEPD